MSGAGFSVGTGARIQPNPAFRAIIGTRSATASGARMHLLMLGGGLMQLPAIRMAREEGWFVIVADGKSDVPGREMADAFEQVDLKDKDGMLVMARSYFDRGCLHGVFTAATDFSATVAWVAENLGLPGNSYETALNASNKLRMREIFRKHGIPSPGFVELSAQQQANAVKHAHLSYPLVVKPVNNMGARGVSRVDDENGLEAALSNARLHARGGSVIVEEFIVGSEYSIDSLVIDGRLTPCGIALRHIHFPPYFVEMGHTLPSDLDSVRESQLVEVFSMAVAALGIRNGAAKGDVFFGPQGPVIGEIAARLSGGYMSGWTFPLASGVEVTRAALYIAMGIDVPRLDWTTNLVSVERAMISVPGTLASIEGLEDAKARFQPDEVFFRVSPGETLVFPKNNVEKSANVIVSDKFREKAVLRAEGVVSETLLRLAPADAHTMGYLFRPLPGGREIVENHERLPEAFPGLLALFIEGLNSFLSKEMFDSAAHSLSQATVFADPKTMMTIPANIPVTERDWAWRSLDENVGLLRRYLPWIRFDLHKPLDMNDLLLSLALLRGGAQLGLWVLETSQVPGGEATLRNEALRVFGSVL